MSEKKRSQPKRKIASSKKREKIIHDFRNALTIISGNLQAAEIIQHKQLNNNPFFKKLLKSIGAEAIKMEELLKTIESSDT